MFYTDKHTGIRRLIPATATFILAIILPGCDDGGETAAIKKSVEDYIKRCNEMSDAAYPGDPEMSKQEFERCVRARYPELDD